MEKELDMTAVVDEIKNANEDELRKVIEKWFEATRTQGLKLGATYISAAIAGAIRKHLNKEGKVTLRDYKRLVDDISKIISVPLAKNKNEATEKTDAEEDNTTKETTNE